MEFCCSDTHELNKLFEDSGFIVVKFVDQLDQHFNRVVNQLEAPSKLETRLLSEEQRYPTIRSILDEDLVTKSSFSIEFYPEFRIGVGFMEDKKHYTLLNHIGDLSSYPLNIEETENEIAISKFETLIDFCFKVYSDPKIKKNKKNIFFEVILKTYFN